MSRTQREEGCVGVEVRVEELTKSFGGHTVWADVSLTLPAGEISVLLGPSGTGKSVFLKTLVGLLRPDRGSIWINGEDLPTLRERRLYEVRKLFGVLFQDGALFGSMNLYDNVAFPLREHTRLKEARIRGIVMAKLEMVGLVGAEEKDATERAAESEDRLPPLPPIPFQLQPSNGQPRRAERAPGAWCAANGVVPPFGSFSEVLV